MERAEQGKLMENREEKIDKSVDSSSYVHKYVMGSNT